MAKKLIDDKHWAIEYWDADRNDCSIDDVFSNSNHKYWWKCTNGLNHDWLSAPSRMSRNRECAVCVGRQILAGFNDFATMHPECMHNWDWDRNNELGIYPTEIGKACNTKVWWKCDKDPEHRWMASPNVAARNAAKCSYCSGRSVLTGNNDFTITDPELMKEWSPDNEIDPCTITFTCTKKVLWRCTKNPDHPQWSATPRDRHYGGSHASPCPTCNGFNVSNSLTHRLSYKHTVASLWSDRNEDTPEDVEKNSTEKRWFHCLKHSDHVFQCRICDMTSYTCPICDALSGKNVNALHSIWCVNRNDGISMESWLSYHDPHDKAWWKCGNGHYWEASISEQYNSECPQCKSDSVVPFESSVANRNPLLVRFWSDRNNRNIRTLSTDFDGDCYWKCPYCGRTWEDKIEDMLPTSKPCKWCSKNSKTGVNDMSTVFPNLASEFDAERNGKSPSNVNAWADDYFYWKCASCDTTWRARLTYRRQGTAGCPLCSSVTRTIIDNVNDIETLDPEVAKLWCTEKNGMTVREAEKRGTFANMNTYWWQCSLRHKPWQASLKSIRKEKERKCPTCSGKILLKGFNDIETTHPELMDEWDWDANTVRPDEITSAYDGLLHWRCRNNPHHLWLADLDHRIRRDQKCPKCNCGLHASGPEDDITDFLYSIKGINKKTKIISNDSTILGRKQLDRYIPEHGFAFEYNGLHWHSYSYLHENKDYHQNKTTGCMKKNVLLMMIWESDWLHDTDSVKFTIDDRLRNRKYHDATDDVTVISSEPASILSKYVDFMPDDKAEYMKFYRKQNHTGLESIISYIKHDDVVEILHYAEPEVCNTNALSLFAKNMRDNGVSRITARINGAYGDWRPFAKAGFEFDGMSEPRLWSIDGQRRTLAPITENDAQNESDDSYLYDSGDYLYSIDL